MKVAFLDRDRTIVKDYEDKEWSNIDRPEFLEGSISTLKKLQSQNYQLIIITNQYLINEKIITINQYHTFTSLMLKELIRNDISIIDIFFLSSCTVGRMLMRKASDWYDRGCLNEISKDRFR